MFFGIESGNDDILRLMKKQININQARKAVKIAKKAGIWVGAFFILGYPGETKETILDTIRYAQSLDLDYCSFTFPYPIPGTLLHQRVKANIFSNQPVFSRTLHFFEQNLIYASDFSRIQMKFILLKSTLQVNLTRLLGRNIYNLFFKPIEVISDQVFKLIS